MSYTRIEVNDDNKLSRDKTWDFQLKSFDKKYKLCANGTIHVLVLTIGGGISWVSPYFDQLAKVQRKTTYDASDMVRIINHYVVNTKTFDDPCVTYQEEDNRFYITIKVDDTFSSNTIEIEMCRQDHLEEKLAHKIKRMKAKHFERKLPFVIMVIVFAIGFAVFATLYTRSDILYRECMKVK